MWHSVQKAECVWGYYQACAYSLAGKSHFRWQLETTGRPCYPQFSRPLHMTFTWAMWKKSSALEFLSPVRDIRALVSHSLHSQEPGDQPRGPMPTSWESGGLSLVPFIEVVIPHPHPVSPRSQIAWVHGRPCPVYTDSAGLFLWSWCNF